MRLERGKRYVVICEHAPCSEIFSRRTCEVARSPRSFCSRACFASEIRTGRTIIEVPCSGCGALFRRVKSTVFRRGHTRAFCSYACYDKHVDRRALGHAGGTASHHFEPGVTLARARAAGAATAKVRSREDWQRLSKMGAAARKAKFTSAEMAAQGRRGQLLRRIGTEVFLGVRLGKREE